MSPQKINSWFVIDLSGERNMSVMNAFVNDLTNTMRERGQLLLGLCNLITNHSFPGMSEYACGILGREF